MRSDKRSSISIILILAAALGAGLLGWRACRGSGGSAGAGTTAGTAPGAQDRAAHAGAAAGGRAARPDPRGLTRGRISGTVRDDAGAPMAGATVCATFTDPQLSREETREPVCATSDATGAYALADLIPATYAAFASAPGHIPAIWRDGERQTELRVGAGQIRAGVDFALAGGAVLIHGVVDDINGGPVGGALVSTGSGGWSDESRAFLHSRDDGTFDAWVKPGTVNVTATADGYASGSKTAAAPGTRVEVLLTPEGTLSGTVVQAGSGAPVAGAMVTADGDWSDGDWSGNASARTDEHGRFRLTRLKPGRYKPGASGDGYYGEPAESVLLALGQSVDGVRIEVHPAAVIEGRIAIEGGAGAAPAPAPAPIAASGQPSGLASAPTPAPGGTAPCTHGSVWLHDPGRNLSHGQSTDADGVVHITGVLPGTYQVQAWCEGYLSKDHYDPITVTGADVTGLVWPVDPGGVIRGRVHDAKGQPIANASIAARTVGAAPRSQRSWGWQGSDKDGSFVLRGLVPGDYELDVYTDDHVRPKDPTKVTVPARGEATADITIDSGGTIHGVVVDEGGKTVTGATVYARGARWTDSSWSLTADDGTFTLRGVVPGTVRVLAQHGWNDRLRNPGSTDDDKQGKEVTVVAGQTAEVRLVVESQSGTISGDVADAKGAAISDAYVVAQRESDSAGAAEGNGLRSSRDTWEKLPVVTGTDGRFTVKDLAPGTYTVRAYRRGGGEAAMEHVAVGGRAHLVMKSAGAITGTLAVTGGGAAPDVFFISVEDRARGFSRSEGFYGTGGAWAMRDLPAGSYTVAATALEGRATTDVTLADGDEKSGVALTLQGMVAIRGRCVELGTGAPVPGLMMFAQPASSDSYEFSMDDDPERKNITDAAGRFELPRAPLGKDAVTGMAQDWRSSPYGWIRKAVTLTAGQQVVDIGDIEVPRRRVKAGDRGGDLGIDFAEQPPDTDPDQMVFKVSHLDPGGPGERAGVKVGDVVVSVDGVDVRAGRAYLAQTLMDVPQGTVLELGLARGGSVKVTAGPPG